MIVVKKLTKIFPSKSKNAADDVRALDGIDLVLPDKGFIVVYGASGCGKSTLLNVIGGLDVATSGEMIVNGRSTKGFTSHDWNSYRNQEVGFVFQNYYLLPHLNVFDNIAITLQMSKQTGNLKKKIENALETVELEKFAKRYPRQLSGGQQQRVAIARALISNPSIILADEPTGALDEKSSKIVMKTLKEVSQEHLVVMVTHNERMAKQYADRLIEISYGKIVYDSAPLKLEKADKKNKDPLSSVHLPFHTSVKWSARNVVKKKGRSIPIAIASAIGLAAAGIVLSMTRGVNNYVTKTQKDAIKDYPVYVTCYPKHSSQSNEANLEEFPHSSDIIIEKSDYTAQEHYITMQDGFIDYMSKLEPNKDYLHLSSNKAVKFNLYTKPNPDSYTKVDTTSYTTCISPNEETYKFLLDDQYDIIYGNSLPRNKNELTLVVDTYNRIDLYALQRMGFDTSGDVIKADEIAGINKDTGLPNKEYRITSNDFYYKGSDQLINIGTETEPNYVTREVFDNYGYEHPKEMYDNSSLTLHIVSIIRPKVSTTNPIYNNILLYHPDLLDYLLDPASGLNTTSEVVTKQITNPTYDVTTGHDFTPIYKNGTIITPTYQYENRVIELGGRDRITSYFYYTDSFEQRQHIIDYAMSYKFPSDSDITIKTTDYLEKMTSAFSSIVKTFSTIVLAFSLVAVLVAGILTAILTYISVVERKREIGLLRSLGARQRDISLMFISEASLIGIAAGILGIGLTYALTPIASRIVVNMIKIAKSKLLAPSPSEFSYIQPWLIPVLFVAGIFIGVISSLIPAIVAGHKKPAEALRE